MDWCGKNKIKIDGVVLKESRDPARSTIDRDQLQNLLPEERCSLHLGAPKLVPYPNDVLCIDSLVTPDTLSFVLTVGMVYSACRPALAGKLAPNLVLLHLDLVLLTWRPSFFIWPRPQCPVGSHSPKPATNRTPLMCFSEICNMRLVLPLIFL